MGSFSKQLSKAKKNYGIIDKEGLTLVFEVKYFRPYLHRFEFIIKIDHALLLALRLLQFYDCTIIHKPGLLHANVDAQTCTKNTVPKLYPTLSDLNTLQQLRYSKCPMVHGSILLNYNASASRENGRVSQHTSKLYQNMCALTTFVAIYVNNMFCVFFDWCCDDIRSIHKTVFMNVK